MAHFPWPTPELFISVVDSLPKTKTNEVSSRLLGFSLAKSVKNELKKALKQDPSNREKTLQQLFRNLSATVDFPLQDYPIEENILAFLPARRELLRYYMILDAFYFLHPKFADEIQESCTLLYSSAHFPSVFSLLFSKWLFSVVNHNPKMSLKKFNVWLKGTNRLFWFDTIKYAQFYKHLYLFCKQLLVLRNSNGIYSPFSSSGDPSSSVLVYPTMFGELRSLVGSYYLFYTSLDTLETKLLTNDFQLYILSICQSFSDFESSFSPEKKNPARFNQKNSFSPPPSFPKFKSQQAPNNCDPSFEDPFNSFTLAQNCKLEEIQSPESLEFHLLYDYFVDDSIRQLRKVHLELQNHVSVALYLSGFKIFDLSKCQPSTSNKLLSTLHTFTTYREKCRQLRHEARKTLDHLFPEGKTIRTIINTWFRVLFNPHSWLFSVFYWIWSTCSHFLHNLGS